jgi:hypothetical protein
LRRDASVAVTLIALSAIPLALLFAWLLGWVRPWRGLGVGPLLLDVAVLLGAGAAIGWGVRRWIRAVDEPAIASRNARGWRRARCAACSSWSAAYRTEHPPRSRGGHG